MELGIQIKKYRGEKGLSQENLAEKLYVSRQTVSNWENEKTYPDINSLLRLSEIFGVSLDTLIKGDVEKMKNEIKKEEITKVKKYGAIYTVLFVLTMVSAVPLFYWLGIKALIPWGILALIMILFSFKVETLKKENNIQTYKEIISFCEGKHLDEIQQAQEYGKRPYQKVVIVIAVIVTTLVVCAVCDLVMYHIFLAH